MTPQPPSTPLPSAMPKPPRSTLSSASPSPPSPLLRRAISRLQLKAPEIYFVVALDCLPAACRSRPKLSRYIRRNMQGKLALNTQMSNEEKRSLKKELRSLKMEDIASFMECLPPDFLTILRTDGLLRSIVSKLGAPRHVRLLAYAKYAIHGLGTHSNRESVMFRFHCRACAFRYDIIKNMRYLQLRALIGFTVEHVLSDTISART